MIFVPLSKVALGTISKQEVGNASGIFNFLRNIGGSIGIAAANTVAQRHLQSHRNELTHWLSGASWLLRRQLTLLTQRMSLHAGPHVSMLRGVSITNSALNAQAQVYAYVDVLRYFGYLALFCVPFAFLLKKPSSGAQGGA